jgi:hypothetical protein
VCDCDELAVELDLSAQPCSDSTLQIGSTPNLSRCSAMNSQIKRRGGSSSRTKKLVAALGISTVRSSSAIFRFNYRISRAAELAPGASPASTSAFRTHLRNVSGPTPTRPAIVESPATPSRNPEHDR